MIIMKAVLSKSHKNSQHKPSWRTHFHRLTQQSKRTLTVKSFISSFALDVQTLICWGRVYLQGDNSLTRKKPL